MKDKFGLVKKTRGYDINSISDQGVCFAMHILAGNIMRKCRENEVHAVVVALDVVQQWGPVQLGWIPMQRILRRLS